MSARCMICGADPAKDDTAVYRLNNKGHTGVWACRPHYAEAKAKYFPDDDPNAPGPDLPSGWDSKPLGPWTGGYSS
jgi:hypothetical protein